MYQGASNKMDLREDWTRSRGYHMGQMQSNGFDPGLLLEDRPLVKNSGFLQQISKNLLTFLFFIQNQKYFQGMFKTKSYYHFDFINKFVSLLDDSKLRKFSFLCFLNYIEICKRCQDAYFMKNLLFDIEKKVTKNHSSGVTWSYNNVHISIFCQT